MYRIMFAGDLHKRSKDITTIEGYVKCNTAVQLELMRVISEYKITHFVSLGDWYDKGYSDDVSASLSDYDLDVQMANQLHGNFYGVIGNHIRLNMDSNPELHLIQPHDRYMSRRGTTRTEQIIKTPNIIRIGDLQISLVHHDIENDNLEHYRVARQPWAKYHVACYHTEKIVPTHKLANTQYYMCNNSNSAIARCVSGVDLAIVGHIHDAIGRFTINTEKGITTMVVPGSLTNVNSSERGRHSMIRIPVITVEDNGEISVGAIPFDLKLNMVTFMQKNVEVSAQKLRSLRGKPAEHLSKTVNVVTRLSTGDQALTSLNAFFAKEQYSERDKKMVKAVIAKPDDLLGLMKIYLGKEDV